MPPIKSRMLDYRGEGGGWLKIGVDNFSGKAHAFFLTHIHSDHTGGICEGWNRIGHGIKGNGFIFCSGITKKLLATGAFGPIPNMDHVIAVDESEEPFVIELEGGLGRLLVYTIDAQHCAGSIMFIINTPKRDNAAVFTGDFRYEEGMTSRLSELAQGPIMTMVVDTTLAHDTWLSPIPTKKESVEIALHQIGKMQKSSMKKRVKMGIKEVKEVDVYILIQGFGQEDFLRLLHKMSGKRIFFDLEKNLGVKAREVWDFFVNKMECLDGAITTNPEEETNFKACPAWAGRRKKGQQKSEKPDDFCAAQLSRQWRERMDTLSEDERLQEAPNAPINVRPSTLGFSMTKGPTKRTKVDAIPEAAGSEDGEDEEILHKHIQRRTKQNFYVQKPLNGHRCLRVLYSMHTPRGELVKFIRGFHPAPHKILDAENFNVVMWDEDLEAGPQHGGVTSERDEGDGGSDAGSHRANEFEDDDFDESDESSSSSDSPDPRMMPPPPANYVSYPGTPERALSERASSSSDPQDPRTAALPPPAAHYISYPETPEPTLSEEAGSESALMYPNSQPCSPARQSSSHPTPTKASKRQREQGDAGKTGALPQKEQGKALKLLVRRRVTSLSDAYRKAAR